jgi:outer membrane protein insertion porin family
MCRIHHARNLSIDSTLNQLGTASALLTILFVSAMICIAQQPQRLGKIEFVGLRQLTAEQVITTSGLQIGQTIDQAVLNTAAQKLMESGLFRKLSFHSRSASGQATVTFEVEEAIRSFPVEFDNFVWFSELDLYNTIRRDISFFDGTVPEGGDTANKIAASLQRLLDEKKISGHVEFMPYGTESGKQKILFSVKGAKIPVCALSFPGATAIAEDQLVKSAHALMQTEYSRNDVELFATHTLLPLYLHLGYLRAQFSPPVAALPPADSTDCKDGVVVTLSVEEGLQYAFDKVEWSGNQALSADQLTAAFAMKNGEVADSRKIEKAQMAVVREYARKGYMALRVKPTVMFDDASQRVAYRFEITEGPQFRMGELTINGLSDEDARRVKELWRLAAGSTFDQSYVDDFVTKTARDFLNSHPVFSGVPLKIGAETKADPKTQTVNVTITFK